MSDDEAIARDLQRARQADELLASPLLTEAFAEQKKQLLEYWQGKTKSEDTAARERLWQAYQIVGMVEAHLRAIIAGGRMAGAHVKQIAKLGDKDRPRNAVVLKFAPDS